MLLLAHNSFCYRLPLKFSFQNHSHNPKVPLLQKYKSNKLRSFKDGWKLDFMDDDFLRHPPGSKPMTKGNNNGVGIDNFFHGKNVFITGATGFLGKVLVEKLLRSTSVGKIYLLIKADDKEAAVDRLSREIMYSDLLESLQTKYGCSYKEFVQEKLIPIVGNISEPNLGMDTKSAQAITDEVDVVIASAANTVPDARYDVLLNHNTIAPQRLLRFAKRCKNIELYVHISTAYVNGKKEGIIYEKPLIMGENARETDFQMPSSTFPQLDPSNEINLAMKSCIASQEYEATKNLRRATFYGWYNAYQLTKAMGEMVIEEIRGDVPVLVIRPSGIEGSYQEPVPGWIQGHRVYDPMITFYGKGLLPGYLANPKMHVDIVPVDIAANITIAAIAKHGLIRKPGIHVYHATTDFVNPLQFSDFFDYMYEHFSKYPLTKSGNIKKMKFFSEFNDASKYIREEISKDMGMSNVVGLNSKSTQSHLQKQYKAAVMYVEQLFKLNGGYGFLNARFHTGNTRKLLDEMSEEERRNFEVDATKIDWRKYFVETHIPGLRKYVHNETMASL